MIYDPMDHPSIYDDEEEYVDDTMNDAEKESSTERRYFLGGGRNNFFNDYSSSFGRENNYSSSYGSEDKYILGDETDNDKGNEDFTGFFSSPNFGKSGIMTPDIWDMFNSEWGQKVQ